MAKKPASKKKVVAKAKPATPKKKATAKKVAPKKSVEISIDDASSDETVVVTTVTVTTVTKPAAKKKAAGKKKPAAKKAAAKKAAAKKPAAKKPAAKKPAAKKAAAKKPAVKKAVAKKAPAAKKNASAKKSSAKNAPAAKAAVPASKPASLPMSAQARRRMEPVKRNVVEEELIEDPLKGKTTPLTKKQLATFKKLLQEYHDRYVDEIDFLSSGALNTSKGQAPGNRSGTSMHMADQGTENFEREMNLNIVSSDLDILHEIDEALIRIENKTYGLCALTGKAINPERLHAMPYARFSIESQEELERGQIRYRKFGPTLSHGS